MTDEYKYDVFISYSHKDNTWVRGTLLPKLKEKGLRVWIDFENLPIGAPVLTTIEKALTESRKICLIFTEKYLASEWCKFENLLPQTKHPTNEAFQIVPVLLKKCDLPPRFGALNYVNFVERDDFVDPWERLLTALGVSVDVEKTIPKVSLADWCFKHTYGMQENFTGREVELKMLDDWLINNKHRMFILRALGGFGKSALAWQWITTHVDPIQWPRVVWWSFYEGDSSFERFIQQIIEYLEIEVPHGQRMQVDELLKAMQEQKTLLIMDGFERALRAYSSINASYQGLEEPKREEKDSDCININAEIFLKNLCMMPGIKSRALITTRMTPRVLEPHGQLIQGCIEQELKELNKNDAIEFLRAQGVKQGSNRELGAACKVYGYHPLSLRLLAGRISKDFEDPGDIMVAQRIKIDGDLIQRQHHVLKVSYDSLPPNEQNLLSTIACFRSAVAYKTLMAITENKEFLDKELLNLIERGLIQHDLKNNKFDLHPIVRHYAYDRFTDSERRKTHTNLAMHFIDIMPAINRNVKTLEDLAPVVELYHHIVRAGNLDEAMDLFYNQFHNTLYFQFGAYQLMIELIRPLFLDGEDKPPRLKNESAQAWTLNSLANSYSLNGQPRRAVPLFEMQNDLQGKTDNKKNLAIGLGNVAIQQLNIGALKEAERNANRGIDLDQQINEFGWEAENHRILGAVFCYCGKWDEAEQQFSSAMTLFRKENSFQMQGVIRSNCALRFLLIAREAVGSNRSSMGSVKLAIECAKRALQLADEDTKQRYTHPRDYANAYRFLGAAYSINNDLALAKENLSKALDLCRQINLVEMEADILLELAKLRYAQEKPEDAKTLAEEALLITERSGYVLQGADVHLFLAQFALEQEKDKASAKELAEKAKALAYCDGPSYYYKVAYEEAERMLEKL